MKKIRLYIDTVIFDLQKAGGNSVYWYQFITRVLTDDQFDVFFIVSKTAKNNIYWDKLDLPTSKIIYTQKIFNRYRDVNYKETDFHIFVSSHYRISKNKKAVNITVLHDFVYEYFVKGLRLFVHHQQKMRAIRRSEHIICISKNTQSDLLKFCGELAAQKSSVVYNGVSDIFGVLSQAELNSQIQKHDFTAANQKYVLYIGNRDGYKNWSYAVEIFKCFPNEYRMISVGGPPLSENERNVLSCIADRHVYIPPVDEAKLNILYNAAACLIYPSDYEGFGIPVVEAQKCGCPVIAQKKSSIPEIAGSGVYFVDKAAPIEINEILAFIDKKFNYDKPFTWDDTYRNIKELMIKLNVERSKGQ